MAKLVDAEDLKSSGVHPPYRFKSGSRHQNLLMQILEIVESRKLRVDKLRPLGFARNISFDYLLSTLYFLISRGVEQW